MATPKGDGVGDPAAPTPNFEFEPKGFFDGGLTPLDAGGVPKGLKDEGCEFEGAPKTLVVFKDGAPKTPVDAGWVGAPNGFDIVLLLLDVPNGLLDALGLVLGTKGLLVVGAGDVVLDVGFPKGFGGAGDNSLLDLPLPLCCDDCFVKPPRLLKELSPLPTRPRRESVFAVLPRCCRFASFSRRSCSKAWLPASAILLELYFFEGGELRLTWYSGSKFLPLYAP